MFVLIPYQITTYYSSVLSQQHHLVDLKKKKNKNKKKKQNKKNKENKNKKKNILSFGA